MILPTLGGQTGLNLATILSERGILEKYDVELIGADYKAIKKAEDREEFKAAMEKIGLEVPRSGLAHTMEEARRYRARSVSPSSSGPALRSAAQGHPSPIISKNSNPSPSKASRAP